MTLGKFTNFHSFSLVIVLIFHVSVETRNNRNHVCLEKSLNGHSVCQHLYTLIKEKERRTQYITELVDIQARMALQEEDISMLKSQLGSYRAHGVNVEPVYVPDPSILNVGQTIMQELNKMWHGIRNLENKMQNVTSFVQKLDVEGVVDVTHAKNLNVRLDSMEKMLSKLTNSGSDSEMTEQMISLRKALTIINETIHQNIRFEDSRESLLEKHSNKLRDLEKLEEQVSVLNIELKELRNVMQDVDNKTVNMEQRLYEVIPSFWKEPETTTENEWTSNFLKTLQNPFASDSALNKNPLLFNGANQMLTFKGPTNQMPKSKEVN